MTHHHPHLAQPIGRCAMPMPPWHHELDSNPDAGDTSLGACLPSNTHASVFMGKLVEQRDLGLAWPSLAMGGSKHGCDSRVGVAAKAARVRLQTVCISMLGGWLGLTSNGRLVYARVGLATQLTASEWRCCVTRPAFRTTARRRLHRQAHAALTRTRSRKCESSCRRTGSTRTT